MTVDDDNNNSDTNSNDESSNNNSNSNSSKNSNNGNNNKKNKKNEKKRPDPPGSTKHLSETNNYQEIPMNTSTEIPDGGLPSTRSITRSSPRSSTRSITQSSPRSSTRSITQSSPRSSTRNSPRSSTRSINSPINTNTPRSTDKAFPSIRGYLDDASTFEFIGQSPNANNSHNNVVGFSPRSNKVEVGDLVNNESNLAATAAAATAATTTASSGSDVEEGRNNSIINAVDAFVVQDMNTNDGKFKGTSINGGDEVDDDDDDYDDDDEIGLDDYEIEEEARIVDYPHDDHAIITGTATQTTKSSPSRDMMYNSTTTTSTTPVNLFDLSNIVEPSQPVYSPVSAMNHHNHPHNRDHYNRDHYNRERSTKLLVKHLTKAAILSEDYEDRFMDMSPALKRRLRDFKFAQRKRRERYGEQNPWGIIGLYDHLTGIRTDIEWAEDAAWRRENDQPYLSWQDFEEAKDTGFNQPFFTYFTMVVCTVCLIISIGLNGWKVEKMTVNPMIGPSAEVLVRMGAKKTDLIVNNGEWFRVFTSMFLHAGIIHFVVNMLALWFIGSAVEQSHGFFAAALLFTLPAIGGTLLSAIFLPEYISVGASGGIFGLIGACLADIISNWGLLFSKHVNENNIGQRFRHVKVLIWLVLDIILNIVIGLTPFVDNFTHMGGMVFGFFCGLSTMERLSKAFFGVKTNWISRVQTFSVRFFGIIVSVLCIAAGFIVLAQMHIVTCRGCRYISCVPFPFWETENKWWYCDDCNKPIVRGKLYQDPSTLYYTHMDLTCPDNSIVKNITLTDNTNDQKFFQQNLASYCRAECDVLFAQ